MPSQELAQRLRTIRHERDLSLAVVAEQTGLSTSFLSLVENGKSDISFSRLYRLIEFYGLSLLDISQGAGATVAVVRSGEERRIQSPREGIEMILLTPDTANRRMMPVLVVYAPGAQTAEPAKHEGDDFVHVLQGRFLLELQGAEPVTLEKGDSAYYRATSPHSYKNVADETSIMFGVLSPPSL